MQLQTCPFVVHIISSFMDSSSQYHTEGKSSSPRSPYEQSQEAYSLETLFISCSDD